MRDATLCYILREGKVLLQKKAAGKFGEGKWNAPGGGIEPRESPEAAAIREVREETGLVVSDLQPCGTLSFTEEGGRHFTVHVFIASAFLGEPRDGGEGELDWFPVEQLPLDRMWADDRFWLPAVLQGKRVRGSFLFSNGFKRMLDQTVEVL